METDNRPDGHAQDAAKNTEPTSLGERNRVAIDLAANNIYHWTKTLSLADAHAAFERAMSLRESERKLSKLSESPIERALLDALLRSGFSEDDAPAEVTAVHGELCLKLRQQQRVTVSGRLVRLDMAIERTDPTKAHVAIAIECDGHDFHERTPEQAERDRSRDRALTLDGWTVLRFTGREITRDADACAAQVLAVVAAQDEYQREQERKKSGLHGHSNPFGFGPKPRF